MIKKGFNKNIIQGFFNFNKKEKNENSNIIKKPTNKRYLVDAIFEENKNKPKILPPSKDP
jgi:hypothetical protein